MQEVGKIRMRSPKGKPTSIGVAVNDKGEVDIHITRTSEGEALIRLPPQIANELGALLRKAATPDQGETSR